MSAQPPTKNGPPEIPLPRVLLFFDYACPFCYVDQSRFEQLGREQPMELVLVPFELRPDLPSEGVSLADVGAGHSEKVDAHILRLAEEGGFPMTLPDFVPNTHLAMAMGELARDSGIHWQVHMAIFHAYYGEGRDIGDREVLLDVAEGAGLRPEDVIEAWLKGAHDQRLHGFRHLAMGLGITATPAALICNELLIGSRPYRVLEASLDRCLVTEESVREAVGEKDGEPATVDARHPLAKDG